MRILALVGLALLASAGAASQSPSRTLTVAVAAERSGEPLPGATIRVARLAVGVAANAAGTARLDGLPADTLTVTVQFVGFAPERRTVDLRAGSASLRVALREQTTALGEVQVVADESRVALTRDVRPVAVLTAADLEELRGQTLGETLGRLNGVTALTTGPTISKPVVRGLHSDRVLILDNGVRQEGQQWGGEHAPEIDPFAANRVEVIKGAAGVEYGAGAIGGVVRLEDAPLPTAPGLAGRLATQAFSNSGQGAVSVLAEDAPAAVRGLAWRLQASARRAGDARAPDFVIRNSAFREASAHLTLGLARGPLQWEAHLRRYTTELGIYVGSHFGNARNLQAIIDRGGPDPAWDYGFSYRIDAPKQVVTHDVASLHAHLDLPGGHEATAQYAVQRNRRREFDAHRPFGDSLAVLGRAAFDLGLWSHTVDLTFTPRASRRLSGSVGLSGMGQLNQNGASGYLVPNFSAYQGGAFAHLAAAATERLSFDAGLRADLRWLEAFPFNRSTRQVERAQRTFTGGAAALGALYTVGEHWSVAANAGSAWRAPNVAELFSFGVHHGTAQFEIGDAALRTERSLDLNATLRHESGPASAEISAYVNHVYGYVYGLEQPEPTVTIRGTFPTVRTTQADARLAGLDADLELRPTGWLDLGARLSALRADNLDLGGPLHGVPTNRAAARARLHTARAFGLTAPFVDAEVRHVARQTRPQPGAFIAAPYPPAYTLVDLRLGATLPWGGRDLRAQLGVSNLLNTRYRDALSRFRYFIDEPGRNVTLSLGVPLR
jgi:iron complex outermembrane receptor protein